MPPVTTVRVFVSATFRDMQAERAYLHNQVFPYLNETCAPRGVRLEFIDMGWQSDEEHAEGFDNLKDCLDQVERCRPFFIGLLGSRYGKGVERVKADAAEAYPWLRTCKTGMSRQHLEMLQGVLNNPERATKSFFYARELAGPIPDEQLAQYMPDFGSDEHERRAALLRALHASGRPVRSYECQWDAAARRITGLDALGEQIAYDLRSALEEELSLKASPRAMSDGPGDAKVDENVQFTVYRPRAVQPLKWYDLLAFAHLSEKPPDAPPEEPDPVEEVQRQAKQLLGEKAADYHDLTQDSLNALPRQGEITFLPEVEYIEFNPKRQIFTWQESVHRVDFRMRASGWLDGKTARGRLSIFLGTILLGDVPLVLKVDSTQQPGTAPEGLEPVSAQRYRLIFASYSHKDLPIVEQFEAYAEAMGDRYLRDWKDLRAGEVWSEKLRHMIAQADVFQLFWSRHSMRSDFVRQEWEYALELAAHRPDFIRPTYWEDPMPTSDQPKLPPADLARLHFQRLGNVAVRHYSSALPLPSCRLPDDRESAPPDSVQGRPQVRQTALQAECLARLPPRGAHESQEEDALVLRAWDDVLLANCPEARPHRARWEKARERLRIVADLESAIAHTNQTVTGEEAIRDLARRLPPGYRHKHIDRVLAAEERLRAAALLENALLATSASDIAIAAASERAKAAGLRLDPNRAQRCELALKRCQCLDQLSRIDRRLPRDRQDNEWLENWDDALLSHCLDAEPLRAEHVLIGERVRAWRNLEAAVDARDLDHIVELAAIPVLSGYPPVIARQSILQDLLRQAQALRRLMELLAKQDDAAAFVEGLDFSYLREHPELYAPYREQIKAIVERWLQQAESIGRSDAACTHDQGTNMTVVRWTWRHLILTHCHVATNPYRFFQILPEAGGQTMNCNVEAHRQAGGGIPVLPSRGRRRLFVTVWPAIDLGWDEAVGPPLHVGPIVPPKSSYY